MKNVLRSVVIITCFASGPIFAVAQMRGGSSGGMGQGQSGSGGMQGQHSAGMGSGGGMSPNGPMLTIDQRRQMMHTTHTQDQQYAKCTQAMNQVREGVKHMMASGANSGQTADAQQSDGSNDQLDSDVQDLAQDQDDFLDSLNDDQKAALQNQIKDVQKKMKQLDELSKELKAELEDKNTDPKKVHEQAKKLDKLSKAIQNEQRQIASALGIQS